MRRDRSRGRHGRRRGAVLDRRLAGRAPCAYGGVVPEVASRRHLELVAPVVRAALGTPASGSRIDRVGVTRARGSWARSSSACPPRRRSPGPGPAARPGRPPPGSRRLAVPRPDPLEPPFTCLLASGGHTLVLAVRDRGARAARLDARRRGRRGVRQGRPVPRARRIRAAPRSTGWPRGRPRGVPFPVARVPGLDFSFSGLKTALLYAVRDLGEELERSPRRPRCVVPAGDRAGVDARLRGGGAHGRPARRRRRRGGQFGAPGRAPGALRAAFARHGQRRHDRVGSAIRAAAHISGLPCPGCVLVARLRLCVAALAALAGGRACSRGRGGGGARTELLRSGGLAGAGRRVGRARRRGPAGSSS